MKRSKLLGGLAGVATGVAFLLGGVLGASSSARPEAQPRPEVVAAQLLEGFSAGDTDAYVAQLESRIAADARDGQALTLVGLAYQQRARETGDPSFYPRSEEALRRALRLERDNDIAVAGLAALAASRHRFTSARVLAQKATRLNPHSATAHGILGDALVELGRYDAAFGAFERMVALKPNLASYSRISYARELLGRTQAAVEAMRMAVTSAGATGEPAAWANAQLGNLYLNSGRLGAARDAFRRALRSFPEHAPALAGLARVHWWRGGLEPAARLFSRALERAPAPDYAIALGDLYVALGQAERAASAYTQAQSLEHAFAANGGRNQLETALFDLDHDRNFVSALRRARVGYRLRPSVEGEHVLAWALYKNGRCGAARKHSIRALRLGTKDTGALLHRSYIERCLGNPVAARKFHARALAANPYALMTVGSPRMNER